MKSNLHIVIQGREITIPIQLTADQLNEIALAMQSDEHLTGWEKPERGSPCYYEDALGRVQKFTVDEPSEVQLELLYSKANCFSSEMLATDMARGDQLIRELRRFAISHRTKPIDRNNGYTIGYNHTDRCLEIGVSGNWVAFGDVIFESEELAREAMNIYASELIWYFTEMKDSL